MNPAARHFAGYVGIAVSGGQPTVGGQSVTGNISCAQSCISVDLSAN
jgi:hypothetical protein